MEAPRAPGRPASLPGRARGADRGLGFFEQLPPNDADRQGRGWRGHYEQWSETPVRGDHWKIDPGTGLMDVTDYLCAHGFCIDVRPERLKQANEIVSRPGSFYARGRIGIIVVSPERKTFLYFYSG